MDPVGLLSLVLRPSIWTHQRSFRLRLLRTVKRQPAIIQADPTLLSQGSFKRVYGQDIKFLLVFTIGVSQREDRVFHRVFQFLSIWKAELGRCHKSRTNRRVLIIVG